jgi:deazaflavin-dependent oxidoreductase (nitroreductase family)
MSEASPIDDDSRDEHAAGGGTPVVARRQLCRTRADVVGDAVFSAMTKLGVGPAHLLTTRGRRTGRLHTSPVIVVKNGSRTWLVSPYGAVSWVLNARAAGRVSLRRGRAARDYAIREVSAAEAGPILKAYVAVAPATRPYFYASQHASADQFVAEAAIHPVFELTPAAA